jgi:hypothetical protein
MSIKTQKQAIDALKAHHPEITSVSASAVMWLHDNDFGQEGTRISKTFGGSIHFRKECVTHNSEPTWQQAVDKIKARFDEAISTCPNCGRKRCDG